MLALVGVVGYWDAMMALHRAGKRGAGPGSGAAHRNFNLQFGEGQPDSASGAGYHADHAGVRLHDSGPVTVRSGSITSAVIATVIYAIVPVIRLTSLGIRQVDKEVVEAAKSFGSTRWQTLLFRCTQIHEAIPTIMTGVNQTLMAMAMVVTVP